MCHSYKNTSMYIYFQPFNFFSFANKTNLIRLPQTQPLSINPKNSIQLPLETYQWLLLTDKTV